MSDDAPSISRLAGQLGYLFEEEPELAHATGVELATSSTTRTATPAPASSTCSRATTSSRDHLDEFPPRITTEMVERRCARSARLTEASDRRPLRGTASERRRPVRLAGRCHDDADGRASGATEHALESPRW